MSRIVLDEQLDQMRGRLAEMSGLVKTAILNAVDALKRQDHDDARAVCLADVEINQHRVRLENDCVAVFTTQQPAGQDARYVAGILEIAIELERMGDYAKDIARVTLKSEGATHLKPLLDIPRMADLATDMLDRALVAFIERDAEAAREVALDDDDVDALCEQIHRELLTYLVADVRQIERGNRLLTVAHDVERFADRVTNICERTVYVATGESVELDGGAPDMPCD